MRTSEERRALKDNHVAYLVFVNVSVHSLPCSKYSTDGSSTQALIFVLYGTGVCSGLNHKILDTILKVSFVAFCTGVGSLLVTLAAVHADTRTDNCIIIGYVVVD